MATIRTQLQRFWNAISPPDVLFDMPPPCFDSLRDPDALAPPRNKDDVENASAFSSSRNVSRRDAAYLLGTRLKHFVPERGWSRFVVSKIWKENGNVCYSVRSESDCDDPVSAIDETDFKMTEAELHRAVALLSVEVGSRLSLFNPSEESYFTATVVKCCDSEKAGFCLRYDLDSEAWVDLREYSFHLLPRSRESPLPRSTCKQEDESVYTQKRASEDLVRADDSLPASCEALPVNVTLGTKVSVLCSDANRFISADVVRIREDSHNVRYCLQFEDGNRRWMELTPRICRVSRREEAGPRQQDLDMTVYTCEPHPLTGSGNFRLDHAPTIPIEERRVSEESEIHGEGGPPHDHVTSEEGQTVGDGGEVTCGPKLACNEEVATASNIPKVNEGRSIESADPQNVIVGSRVAVWWPDDAKFYNGTVVSYRRTRKRNRFHLEYDDNEKEWIDFDSNNFQFLEGSKQRPTNKRGDEHARMVRRIQSGSRVAVYWSLDRQYYNATVRSISPGSKPHHLVYDDGEEEHVDLLSHSFLILANGGGNGNCSHSGSEGELQTAEGDRRGRGRVRRTSESSTRGTSSDGIDANANQDFGRDRADANDAKDVIVGSRVSVWWPRDRANYDATVIEFRSGKRRPYLIRYDDSDEEWIDFREHTFRFLRGSVKRPDGSRGDRHSSKVEQVRSGSRVAVWWPLERQFYSATVRSVKPAPNPHQVVYDDGDEERIDLNFHDFFIIGNGSDESRIDSVQGTRMALAPASEASVAEAENVPCSSPASKPRTGKRGIGGSKHTRSQPKTDKVRKSFRKG